MDINILFDKWALMVRPQDSGDYWISRENFGRAIVDANISFPVEARVILQLAEVNKIINESMETAKLEMDASEHPSVYSYFEGQISVLETIQHKFSKLST